ncbi:MAG: ATP-binding protein [Thermoleophilaceae bacterium]|nr:ATP-binding protein [Thermoleophilaceae bacterium]
MPCGSSRGQPAARWRGSGLRGPASPSGDRAFDQRLPGRSPRRVRDRSAWVGRLEAAQHRNALDEDLKRTERYAVIVIDQIGYLPWNAKPPTLLFSLVSRRYEPAR